MTTALPTENAFEENFPLPPEYFLNILHVKVMYKSETHTMGMHHSPPPICFGLKGSVQPKGYSLMVGAYMHRNKTLPANLSGHAFVGIERPDGRRETFGFSPRETFDLCADAGRLNGGVTGNVDGARDALSKPGVRVARVPITESQALAALRKVDQYRGQTFNAKVRQCTTFAADVAGAAGVRIAAPGGQPRAFYDAVSRPGGIVQGYFRGVIQAKGDAFSLPQNFRLPAGPGQPLPDAVRNRMERFYNADFNDVRIHVGPEAPAIGALAFTVGNTIVFAPGQYDPASRRGQQILGHELAHVVQQRAGRVHNPYGNGLAVVQDRALEAEADRLGIRAAMGW